jgi:long-chain acyl-CoA synthetase
MPKYLRKLAAHIFVSMENSSPLKKAFYKTALRISRRHLENVPDGKETLWSRLTYFICYQAAFRPILNKLGFNRLKIVLSTGAPLPPDIMAFWQICGANLSEFYGLTETGGAIISAQGSYFPRPGNVGKPSTGWEVKLSDGGEILIRGNDLFEGYWNNPELKNQVSDQDGWFRTGDAGEWDPDGNLKLFERPQDFIVVPGGQRIYPTPIENNLRSSPYISEAIVFSHNGKYLSSLIEIDFETVSDWANRNNILFTGFTSLIEHSEIIKFMGAEIEKINKLSSPHGQIKAFRILPKELNPAEDEGPVTPTRKIKRDVMYNKFKDLVESMYHNSEAVEKHLK